MFGAEYLENVWRYRLSYNGAPIGNGTWGIKWSRARWHHVTLLPVCRATGVWRRLRLSSAFSTEHGVFIETLKYKPHFLTLSVTRKQFYDTCLQKYCLRNHF